MKTCGRCSLLLPFEDFGRHKKTPDGRQSWCSPCQRAYQRERRQRLVSRAVIELPATKRCPHCERVKPPSDFHANKSARDGLQPYCAECSVFVRREWSERHAEAIKAKQAEKILRGAQADEPKACTRCGVTKPAQAFYVHRGTRDGRATHCIDCQKARTRQWNAANRDRIAARNAEYRAAQDKDWRRDQRHIWLKRYGLTPDTYDELLQKQNGVCAVCHLPERFVDARTGETRRLAVDHCHSTGRVRGLLCGRCNRSIGQFADDPERLSRAAAYLREAAG